MPENKLLDLNLPETACISMIGMPAAGKSLVGRVLASRISWGFLDSDYVIEAAYGTRLQNVADRFSKEEFLDIERSIILSLRAYRVVIATGGSVVYRPEAMAYLASLGPVVHLDVSLPIILERIARNPDRGLAIDPGQTVEDLYKERRELYAKYASATINADRKNPDQCAIEILRNLNSI